MWNFVYLAISRLIHYRSSPVSWGLLSIVLCVLVALVTVEDLKTLPNDEDWKSCAATREVSPITPRTEADTQKGDHLRIDLYDHSIWLIPICFFKQRYYVYVYNTVYICTLLSTWQYYNCLRHRPFFCWFCALAFNELVRIWLGPFRHGGMLMSQVVGYRVMGWSPSRCRVPPLGQGDDNFNHMWHIRRSAIAMISPTWIYQEITGNLHGMVRNDQSYKCPKVT